MNKMLQSFSALGLACFTLSTAIPAANAQTMSQRPVSASVQISGSCSGCDMSGRVMPRISMQGSNFAGSDFSHSNLSGAKFYKSNFANASFHKAYLMRIEGEGVNLRRSVLRDATLTEATLIKSDLSGVDLRGADLSRGRFAASAFNGANLRSAEAQEASFTNCDFKNAKLHHANFTKANLSGAMFIGTDFGDANLTDSDLTGANLSGAQMRDVIGLKQSQISTACGNDETVLPAGITAETCAELEAAPLAGRAKAEDGYSAPPAPRAPSAFMNNVRQVASAQSRAYELERAIAEVKAVIRDLPLDSPSRKRLQNSLDSLEKLRDRPKR